MPELTKIRVREAKPRDRGLFKKLWKAFLEEEHKNGGITLPTEKNIEFSAGVFDSYVNGIYEGIVLFVADKAVLMFGDPVMSFETSLGKTAYSWGVYVDPEFRGQKISSELIKVAVDKLKAFGFNHLCNEVREGYEPGSLKALEHLLSVETRSNIISMSLNGEK